MGLKVINLDYLPTFGLGMEKEEAYDEIYKSKGFFGRLLMKLVGRVRYFPQVTFQKEDIDEEVVRELVKHKDLLDAVERWITYTDLSLLPKLKEAKKVFEAIQTPKRRELLYRGFPSSNKGPEEKFKDIGVGDTYSYTPNKLMSFTFNRGTSEDFGDVVVSVEFDKEKDRMFHITNEIVLAYLVRDVKSYELVAEAKIPTFGESVFLPDGKPLRFTLQHK